MGGSFVYQTRKKFGSKEINQVLRISQNLPPEDGT